MTTHAMAALMALGLAPTELPPLPPGTPLPVVERPVDAGPLRASRDLWELGYSYPLGAQKHRSAVPIAKKKKGRR